MPYGELSGVFVLALLNFGSVVDLLLVAEIGISESRVFGDLRHVELGVVRRASRRAALNRSGLCLVQLVGEE